MKTKDDLLKQIKLYLINRYNKEKFQSGGIALPHFNTCEDYEAFIDAMNYLDEPGEGSFSECNENNIVFDLPPSVNDK